jgi:hypothetical protein
MKFPVEKLRIKDLHTLVETQPPPDRSRPLEWRRRMNRLRFEASLFSVDSTHWVNDVEHLTGELWKDGQDRDSFSPVIKSGVKRKLSVSTTVSFDDIEDRFYQTVEVDKEERVVTVNESSRAKNLVVTLSEDEPQAQDFHTFKAGSYIGNAMFLEDDRDLLLEITASEQVMLELVNAISSGKIEKVIFIVSISSFSYEVDDALRDWNDRRDFLVHGFSTPAALQAIVIRSRGNCVPSASKNFIDPQRQDTEERVADETELPPSSPKTELTTSTIAFNASSFKAINFALWTIAAVLFLIFLK